MIMLPWVDGSFNFFPLFLQQTVKVCGYCARLLPLIMKIWVHLKRKLDIFGNAFVKRFWKRTEGYSIAIVWNNVSIRRRWIDLKVKDDFTKSFMFLTFSSKCECLSTYWISIAISPWWKIQQKQVRTLISATFLRAFIYAEVERLVHLFRSAFKDGLMNALKLATRFTS